MLCSCAAAGRAVQHQQMARPRPLEASTFIILLGTLLAYHGGVEARAPYRSRHAQTPSPAWLPRRFYGESAATTADTVPCEGQTAQEHLRESSLSVLRVAAVLRGGRSMGQQSGTQDEKSEGNELAEEGHDEEAGGEDEEEQEQEEQEEVVLYDEREVEWMMQQLCMYQTRTALISKPLAAKVCTSLNTYLYVAKHLCFSKRLARR